MPIVNWEKPEDVDFTTNSSSEHDQIMLMTLLKFSERDMQFRWTGRLVVKPMKKQVIVELRKYIHGAHVV